MRAVVWRRCRAGRVGGFSLPLEPARAGAGAVRGSSMTDARWDECRRDERRRGGGRSDVGRWCWDEWRSGLGRWDWDARLLCDCARSSPDEATSRGIGTVIFKLKVQRERVLSVRDRKVDLLVGAQRVRQLSREPLLACCQVQNLLWHFSILHGAGCRLITASTGWFDGSRPYLDARWQVQESWSWNRAGVRSCRSTCVMAQGCLTAGTSS